MWDLCRRIAICVTSGAFPAGAPTLRRRPGIKQNDQVPHPNRRREQQEVHHMPRENAKRWGKARVASCGLAHCCGAFRTCTRTFEDQKPFMPPRRPRQSKPEMLGDESTTAIADSPMSGSQWLVISSARSLTYARSRSRTSMKGTVVQQLKPTSPIAAGTHGKPTRRAPLPLQENGAIRKAVQSRRTAAPQKKTRRIPNGVAAQMCHQRSAYGTAVTTNARLLSQ